MMYSISENKNKTSTDQNYDFNRGNDNNRISDNNQNINDNDNDILKLIDFFFIKSCSLICSTLPKSAFINHNSNNIFRDYSNNNIENDWFKNDSLIFSNQMRPLSNDLNKWLHWDSISPLPPLVIETFLDLTNLNENDTVRLKDTDHNLWNVTRGTKKKEIVLERWLLELDNLSNSFKESVPCNDLFNQIILLLRYLNTLIQLLPINSLSKTLSHQDASTTTASKAHIQNIKSARHNFSIGTRILDGSKQILSKGRIGLSKPIISTYSNVSNESNLPPHLDQKKITPVATKFGLLRVSVSYRRECDFELQNNSNIASTTSVNKNKTGGHAHGSQNTPQHTASNNNHSNASTAGFNIRTSTSISPKARNSFEQHLASYQKKPANIARQIQPFKVGSVNSATNERINSQFSSRNPSNSSMLNINNNKINRKSSVGSTNLHHLPTNMLTNNNSINNHTNTSNNFLINSNNNVTGSVQSNIHLENNGSMESGNSKYFSSFSNLRRHSNVNRNVETINSIDRALRSNTDMQAFAIKKSNSSSGRMDNTSVSKRKSDGSPEKSNESDILDFVKLIDEKPEIRVKKSKNIEQDENNNFINPHLISNDSNVDHISNSINKYQNLRHNNEMLSDDLSMSYTLQSNAQQQQLQNLQTNANGTDITPSFSHHSDSPTSQRSHYSNSSYLHTSHCRNHSNTALDSRKSSFDRNKITSLPPIYGDGMISSHEDSRRINSTGDITADNFIDGKIHAKTNDNLAKIDVTDHENEKDLVSKKTIEIRRNSNNIKWRSSISPQSVDSILSYNSMRNNILPYKHTSYHFSQPTLVSAPAHAKLQRPSVQSMEILSDEGKRYYFGKNNNKNNNLQKARRNSGNSDEFYGAYENDMDGDNENGDTKDDEDLMFFMSDMNITSKL